MINNDRIVLVTTVDRRSFCVISNLTYNECRERNL